MLVNYKEQQRKLLYHRIMNCKSVFSAYIQKTDTIFLRTLGFITFHQNFVFEISVKSIVNYCKLFIMHI